MSAAGTRTVFVLGSYPCNREVPCAALVGSDDEGRTWRRVPAPTDTFSRTFPAGIAAGRVTFADPRNGWVYRGGLWSTHDGGLRWRRVPLAAGVVTDVAVAGGRVYAVAQECDVQGGQCQFGRVITSPISTDRFRPAAVPRLGFAGGSFQGSLSSGGGSAYYVAVVSTDRAVRTYLYSTRGGAWARARAPCGNSYSPPLLARANSGPLFAVCPGEPGAGNQRKLAFVSTSTGRSWRRRARPPDSGYATSLTTTTPGTLYLANERGSLVVSRNAGRRWHAVLAPGDGDGWSQVTFASVAIGYAVPFGLNAQGRLSITTDGGRTWRLRAFR